MSVTRRRLTVYITEHDRGGIFYEWKLRNVERWEVLDILQRIVNDLKKGSGVITSSIPKGEM